MPQTLGLSPKAILAFAFPLIAALAAALTSYIVTGNFSDSEIRTALGGLVTSALAALGAYAGRPGTIGHLDVAPSTPDVIDLPDGHPGAV